MQTLALLTLAALAFAGLCRCFRPAPKSGTGNAQLLLRHQRINRHHLRLDDHGGVILLHLFIAAIWLIAAAGMGAQEPRW